MQPINKVIALTFGHAPLAGAAPACPNRRSGGNHLLHRGLSDPGPCPHDQACTADDYTLNIVMEGVGLPNEQGELEGVTIVADLAAQSWP